MTWSWICPAVVEIDFLHWISSLSSLVPPPFNDRKVENWLWEKWDWLLFKYCLCLTCKKRMSQIQQCISFWKAPHKLNLFYLGCNVWNSNWVCFGKRLSRHRAGGEFRRPIKEFSLKSFPTPLLDNLQRTQASDNKFLNSVVIFIDWKNHMSISILICHQL